MAELESVECLHILDGRIVSVQFKDKAANGNAQVVVAGKDVMDAAACLELPKKQIFDGHISIEQENHCKDSVPQVRANIDFVRDHAK